MVNYYFGPWIGLALNCWIFFSLSFRIKLSFEIKTNDLSWRLLGLVELGWGMFSFRNFKVVIGFNCSVFRWSYSRWLRGESIDFLSISIGLFTPMRISYCIAESVGIYRIKGVETFGNILTTWATGRSYCMHLWWAHC